MRRRPVRACCLSGNGMYAVQDPEHLSRVFLARAAVQRASRLGSLYQPEPVRTRALIEAGDDELTHDESVGYKAHGDRSSFLSLC